MGTQTESWELRVGHLTVYPGQGVTRIESLEEREIGGQCREFLVLRKLEDSSRIMIPRDRIDEVGLRAVVPVGGAQKVWEILRDHEAGGRREGVAWSRQVREYQDKIRNGSVFEVAEVLRDLLLLQRSKDLAGTERKLLDQARSMLVQELAAAQRRPPDRIEAEILHAVG